MYPVPTVDFYEQLRSTFTEIKGAYAFMGKLNCNKVLEDIASNHGIVVEEHSKGIDLAKFIMRVNRDKIEQLCRESYKDRPKTEVDVELIGNESFHEDPHRKVLEDQKKAEERLKKILREPTALRKECISLSNKILKENTVSDIVEMVRFFFIASARKKTTKWLSSANMEQKKNAS